MKRLACLNLLILALFWAGCSSKFHPYDTSIRLNYEAKEIPASIQISDPQFYKRESLINERRDETEYLNDLLEKSRTVTFQPELIRDIEAVSSLSTQLGISFDPAAKMGFNNAAQLSNLETQVKTTELQAKLALVQHDLDRLKASFANQSTASSRPGSTSNTTIPTTQLPGLATAKETADRLGSLVKDLTGRLDAESKAPRATSAGTSPLDLFQDRQAYRRVVQGAVNVAALDDLHDYKGNSLYRMQFRATVLPGGKELDRSLGILRMQIEPPVLTKDQAGKQEINNLYNEWLDHVTLRLNEIISTETVRSDPVLMQLGAEGKLFSIMTVAVPKDPGIALDSEANSCRPRVVSSGTDSSCHYIRIAVPPIAESLHDVQSVTNLSFLYDDKAKISLRKGLTALSETKALREAKKPLSAEQTLAMKNADTMATELISNQNRVLDLERRLLTFSSRTKLLSDKLAVQLSEVTRDSQDLLKLAEQFEAISGRKDIPVFSCGNAPEEFIKALFEETACGYEARGRVSTYAVTPVELVQHVSTAARAANAVQMAASLAASLPTQGVGANAGMGYMNEVSGKADALQRVPLVVGYSDPVGADLRGKFGWLLGPKVVLDQRKKALALEHNIAPYDLTVDISMPGWWKNFEIKYYSSWAPDWQKQPVASLPADENLVGSIPVEKRHSRSDLDGITSLLLDQMGIQKIEMASIGRIDPQIISACADTVTFMIQGTNLWRTQNAYLMGTKATSIQVLPDMGGISATFDISKLPQRPTTFVPPQLILATPNGPAYSNDIVIEGSRFADKRCGQEGVSLAREDDSPSISSVLPGTIFSCDEKIRLVVRGKNLKDVTKQGVYLGIIPADKVTVSADGKGLEVTFEKKIGTSGGSQTSLPLIVTTAKGVSSKDVAIERKECPEAAPKPAAKKPVVKKPAANKPA